ncbi:MAG: hypothetical protein HY355_00410 [Armatimonadetes bacterium]|nr:hypothetical protein [Armatimonadota bacterium]
MGILGLVGAAMVFVGFAALGGLLAVLTGARSRMRGPRRLALFSLLAAILVAGGAALTRPEARAAVAGFALVPLLAAYLMARADLRRSG